LLLSNKLGFKYFMMLTKYIVETTGNQNESKEQISYRIRVIHRHKGLFNK